MSLRVKVSFEQHLSMRADDAYRTLCDWEDHGRWIPLTKVQATQVQNHGPESFTAYTGVWPLRLTDRMRVSAKDDTTMSVTIEKIGPYLTGEAGFTVRPFDEASCVVVWREDVNAPYLPSILGPVVSSATRVLFKRALKRMPTQQ